MGVNITCTAAEDGSSFAVSVPSNFHPELPIKMLTHGFASTVAGAGQCSAVEGFNHRELVLFLLKLSVTWQPGWRDTARVLVLSSLTGLISPPSPE